MFVEYTTNNMSHMWPSGKGCLIKFTLPVWVDCIVNIENNLKMAMLSLFNMLFVQLPHSS